EATEMIVMGFIEPFTRELPMEYAKRKSALHSRTLSSYIYYPVPAARISRCHF
ncbi:hypothetical protein ACT4UL_10075, partial [Bacillus sp. HC-TM]